MLDVIVASFEDLWNGVVAFIPELVAAIVVFLVGWAIAVGLGKVAEQIIRAIRVDAALERLGFRRALARAGMRLDSGKFLGGLVKWFFILVFLLAAADIVGLAEVSSFLQEVLFYLPDLVVAVVILIASVLVANFVQKVVVAGVRSGGMKHAGVIAAIAKWAVLIFGLLIALFQLGVAPSIISNVVTAFVAMLALAGGLAFGLGGQKHAGKLLDAMGEDIAHRHDE